MIVTSAIEYRIISVGNTKISQKCVCFFIFIFVIIHENCSFNLNFSSTAIYLLCSQWNINVDSNSNEMKNKIESNTGINDNWGYWRHTSLIFWEFFVFFYSSLFLLCGFCSSVFKFIYILRWDDTVVSIHFYIKHIFQMVFRIKINKLILMSKWSILHCSCGLLYCSLKSEYTPKVSLEFFVFLRNNLKIFDGNSFHLSVCIVIIVRR